jgi:hypothetical protein
MLVTGRIETTLLSQGRLDSVFPGVFLRLSIALRNIFQRSIITIFAYISENENAFPDSAAKLLRRKASVNGNWGSCVYSRLFGAMHKVLMSRCGTAKVWHELRLISRELPSLRVRAK